MKRRTIESSPIDLGHLVNLDGLAKLPGVQMFLHDAFYEDTDPVQQREPGTIFVMVRNGKLNITLREPTQGLVCRLECGSCRELWAAIEGAVTGPSSLWQVDPSARKPWRGKKK